ncbi:hypothetical protein K439DRAFT_1623524 [Ramaria rubella]|nr:hypothetical protein K439DRAFT_1623524 [Ramaria rubella]
MPTSNYYYPLTAPAGAIRLDHSPAVDWDPGVLPLRTDATYTASLLFIQQGSTQTERERWAKTQGINGVSILCKTPGFSRSQSCLHELIHLIFENIICNLVDLWIGRFKGLDDGTEHLHIPPNIWELVGAETAAPKSSTPSAFAWPIPNITKEQDVFTAEAWVFWFIYLAPHLLQGRLPRKYYDHMMSLIEIMQICFQFVITDQEIDALEQMIICWVRKYEQYYYQFNKERLSMCTSTTHALLHVCYYIRTTGPVRLLAAVKSKSKPYTTISRRIMHLAQISQISLKYGLRDTLNFEDNVCEISRWECVYPESIHLATQFRKPWNFILKLLPTTMERWAKVRISDGGDCICTSTTGANRAAETQVMSYDLVVDTHAHKRKKQPQFETQCFYGQLMMILVCDLPSHSLFNHHPERRLLAVVITCNTGGQDGTLTSVTYTKYLNSGSPTVIELTAISCVIGCVKVGQGNTWGIID